MNSLLLILAERDIDSDYLEIIHETLVLDGLLEKLSATELSDNQKIALNILTQVIQQWDDTRTEREEA